MLETNALALVTNTVFRHRACACGCGTCSPCDPEFAIDGGLRWSPRHLAERVTADLTAAGLLRGVQ